MTREAILSLLDHLCNEARNSMHALYGLMEFEPETANGPTWQTCLDASRTGADRLLQTIDDMREMLSGKASEAASVEEFDLPKYVSETAILLNMTSGDHAAKLMVESLEESIRIRQNRHSLEQVLVRVLNLAVKQSHGGSVRVTVSASEMDRVCIAIAPSQADPSHADPSNPDPSNANTANADLACRLANWINADAEQVSFHENDIPTFVAALVAGRRLHSMGGVAEASCNPGEVPSLLLYLPRQIAGGAEAIGLMAGSAAAGKKLQVLVAEDCDESFVLTEMLLRSETVDRARNGLEAIDKIMRRRYDIVFMDVHMPGLDGYDTIRAIRQWETQSANARTPIVVLSSDDIATQKRCAAQAGCSGFLRKPIRQPDLVDVLQPLRAARELAA